MKFRHGPATVTEECPERALHAAFMAYAAQSMMTATGSNANWEGSQGVKILESGDLPVSEAL